MFYPVHFLGFFVQQSSLHARRSHFSPGETCFLFRQKQVFHWRSHEQTFQGNTLGHQAKLVRKKKIMKFILATCYVFFLMTGTYSEEVFRSPHVTGLCDVITGSRVSCSDGDDALCKQALEYLLRRSTLTPPLTTSRYIYIPVMPCAHNYYIRQYVIR